MPEKSATRKAPKESKDWIRKQIMAGLTLCATLFLGAYYFLPLPAIQAQSPVDRFILTIRCLFVSSLPIPLILQSVGNARFNTTAIDPVKGGGEDIVDVPNRILRNTIEQYIMHAVAMLTLCTFLDEDSLKVLPILSVIFVIFRLLFWWGYLSSPLNRAVGMSGTAMPIFLTYLYCLYRIIKNIMVF
ncbi:transmembrane protein 79-like [Saccostrea cucullata]|uniref:transmembrane protein 79-like n=1 Tax=Saccostrea cuccullata TaxID=36930 RepID=UPI002ED51A45